MGVQPILDAVGHYLPCPLDRPPVEGIDPKKPDKVLTRKPSADEPFCGLVFKILPAKTGDLYWIRVYSGTLESNSRVYNPNRDKKENVAQLWQIHCHQERATGPGRKLAVRRYRLCHRPAGIDYGRYAVRYARHYSTAEHSVRSNRYLNGHRA